MTKESKWWTASDKQRWRWSKNRRYVVSLENDEAWSAKLRKDGTARIDGGKWVDVGDQCWAKEVIEHFWPAARSTEVKEDRRFTGLKSSDMFFDDNGIWLKGRWINSVIWHHLNAEEPGTTPEVHRLFEDGIVRHLEGGNWLAEPSWIGSCSLSQAAIEYFWPSADTDLVTTDAHWVKGQAVNQVMWYSLDHVSSTEFRLTPDGQIEFLRDGVWSKEPQDCSGSIEARRVIRYFWDEPATPTMRSSVSQTPQSTQSTQSAAEFLQGALGHMQDRASTYDKPQGERSMGNCVAAFNTITGQALTEEQGWLFMALLKIVRAQQGKYRADNYEDLAAYAGLAGEAAARDR